MGRASCQWFQNMLKEAADDPVGTNDDPETEVEKETRDLWRKGCCFGTWWQPERRKTIVLGRPVQVPHDRVVRS